MNKLTNEELGNITGGVIFNASGISGSDSFNPWEVLDNHGDVVARFPSKEAAIYFAGQHNLPYNEVDWDEVCRQRDRYH